MVECEQPVRPVRSVRSGPQITVRWSARARRRLEIVGVAALFVALTASLVNANSRATYEANRGARVRKLYWEEEQHAHEYAGALHRNDVYARVLEERLTRYEPGQQTAWRRTALDRLQREVAEALARD
jgi:hypothetical protein